MRGRYKGRDPTGREQNITAGALSEPEAAVPGVTVCDRGGGENGSKCSIYGNERVYLGVRVRMPVRDLLRNIRRSQGQEPQDFRRGPKTRTGNMKRARTRSRKQTIRVQDPMKSLEELAIILEVLEEDLRTGNNYHSLPKNLSASSPPANPEFSPSGYSDEYDVMIPSPESYMTYSTGTTEHYQTMSPPHCMFSSVENTQRNDERGKEWFALPNHNQDQSSSAFFWMQLLKEENQLSNTSDAELLATDKCGRTALHEVVCMGKRALGYATAKRMAALNRLDFKDCDGMTALLYAAKYNQHLMMADLIHLGANVNETNNLGKSCLHLSAENGYIRVLEVLKQAMRDGVYIDVKATDNSGMSVLQCASVALKNSMCEVRSNKSQSDMRLHTLRQEQMMETLECLLQMDSYLHTAVCQTVRGQLANAAQTRLSFQHICPPGHF
ncbi:uncharacterized protein PAE49_010284 isoform 1-T2 [Odontesthes bonariensis]|uniref:uncharacterized protein LOC142388634 n=1 Tax=Odontesthes bonariensis TaxID=219752 RepID=UPI003F5899BE